MAFQAALMITTNGKHGTGVQGDSPLLVVGGETPALAKIGQWAA